jgi:phosphoglycolate phosphatase-like HAD superfamily hydrolase
VEKLNEQMRANFLSKYGKQMEENQLALQAVTRKVEHVVVDDLEVKRMIRESEKKVIGRVDAFEEQDRAVRMSREEKEDLKEEADKAARFEEEHRRRKFEGSVVYNNICQTYLPRPSGPIDF